MSSRAQLTGYGTVAIVDQSTENLNEATGSWVEANVILPAKLIDEKNFMSDEQPDAAADTTNQATPMYHDVTFALLFIAQLAVFTFVGILYGSTGALSVTDQSTNENSGGAMEGGGSLQLSALLSTSAVVAFAVAYSITAIILPKYPLLAIQASLYGNFITWTIFGMFIFISRPNIWTLLLLFFLGGINFWYFFAVQRFVPFATTNLKMATKAISANFGIYFVAFLTAIIGIVWMGFWAYTATGLGIFDDIQNAVSDTSTESSYYYDYDDAGVTNAILGFKGFGLLVSLYWTIAVLANIVQTTTAGVTGTWCFDKDNASSCCSSAVTQSLYRSCTYSFGSICFGSLLTALITTLRVLAQWARDNSRNDDNNGAALLYCILTCILSLVEDLIDYFNQWAYIFVGIWGLSYLESGRRVMELFAARGCTAIISDGLSNYVLTNVVIFTSFVCGICGYIFGRDGASFFASFFVGIVIASSMMAIVQGAVKAVIVCYADHPHKLHMNHPEETTKLSQAIALAYPTILIPIFTDVTV